MTQFGQRPGRESVVEENLRRVYDMAPEQAAPQRLRDLLEALRAQDRARSLGR